MRNTAASFVEFEVGDILEVPGLAGSAGGDKGLEGCNASIRKRCQIVEIPRYEPPHRGIVGPTLALGGAKLKLQRLNVRRGGNCVEWHFDKGSDAACNHGLRAGFITFPFGAARFAHMHVGVDHARHHILA